MKFFSYAMVYAFFVFLIFLFIKFFRFAYVRIKAYVIHRNLSKKVAVNNENPETEKKKDD